MSLVHSEWIFFFFLSRLTELHEVFIVNHRADSQCCGIHVSVNHQVCSELVFYFGASLSCFAIEWQLEAKGHCARLNETSRAALDPRVCLLPEFKERALLEQPQREKKIGKKKPKMSSGHQTAVVVHSPPLSARAIKAVCDCTLGAVNVKAVAGRKKKRKKGGDTRGQVRSGMEEQSLLSGGNRPAAATAGSRLARWSSESRNHSGGLLTAGGRPGGR